MKAILLGALLATGQCCMAQSDTNLIATGDWSAPASEPIGRLSGPALRGRLAVYNAPEHQGRVYLELQRVSGQDVWSPPIGVFYDFTVRSSSLRLELRGSDERPVSGRAGTASAAGAQAAWVTIPSDSTVRLRATTYTTAHATNSDGLEILVSDGSWVIPADATNDYYLSGTFAPTRDHANAPSYYLWQGIMKLPAVKIPAKRP